jgi:outer membrane protein assembly factor BamB
MKNILLTVIYIIASLNLSSGQKISEWRPDNRTGVSSEKGLLKSWPSAGPALIWLNVELPSGFSSASFGKNSIFVTGAKDKSDVLIALDTLGKIKWQTPYGKSWDKSYPDSRCTPTVEGNKVYVSSGSGEVACIDALGGKIIWSVNASEIYKGTFGPWGIAESLIVDGDKVYFTPGGSETMTVALNKNTGKLVWKSESLNDRPAYISPILISYSGKRMFVNISASYVYAMDPATGKIIWSIKHSEINSKKAIAGWDDAPACICVTPLYYDGKIYVSGGYDHGGIMLKMTDGGTKVAVDWTDDVLDIHHGGAVLVNGFIYGANWINNGDGNWCCIDWKTGQKKYEEHWKCKGSVISAEGLLYIYDEKSGNVGLVKANPDKFDMISSFKISKGSGPYWAHPVIHNGKLFIRHGKALMVYNIKA